MTHRFLAWTTAVLIVAFQSSPVSGQDQNPGGDADDAHWAFQEATRALDNFNTKHSRFFRGARVPIHYLEWTEKGTPLVFLHGTYSTAHDLVRFAPKLIEAGYRPISVDWYGHGKTPIPTEPVSGRDFAKDLKLLLDALEIEKTVMVGHSRGGVLAGEFYRMHPKRVSGMVLIDGGSTCIGKYFANLGRKGLGEWLNSAFDDEGKPLAPSFTSLEELFCATWERFGKPDDAAEMFDVLSQSSKNDAGRWTRWRQTLREWLKQDNRDNTINGMLTPAEAPLFFGSTLLFEPTKAFAKLDVPMLILDATGGSAQYRDATPTEENERLQKLHPDLITHVKMPTGHYLHREKPDEFIGHLHKFRKQLK